MNIRIILLTLLLLVTTGISSEAWIFVPDQGDTGWRTYQYQAGPAGFSGTAGFVVSNVIDGAAYSELLLDNLSQGSGSSNRGFELGNYSGYNFLGNSSGEVTDAVIAFSGNLYGPTRGDYFSHQLGLGLTTNSVVTSAFQNASHQAGTWGSILETALSLPAGGSFTFDWAFLAGDMSPWDDFALFYLKNSTGNIVFTDGLAQIGSVPDSAPLPSGILLLGSGLLGLWGWRRCAKSVRLGPW
jgi:hypothetical protein